jgi:hypothetical protein
MGDAPTTGPDLTALNASFRRTLRAQNKSDRTVEAYTDAVRLLADFCAAGGHPLTVSALKRKHIELFIADQLAHWKPATANNRYRGLQSFFTWALAEGPWSIGMPRPPPNSAPALHTPGSVSATGSKATASRVRHPPKLRLELESSRQIGHSALNLCESFSPRSHKSTLVGLSWRFAASMSQPVFPCLI